MKKIIKDILFVSYLKNKGIRRICFVTGIIFCTWMLFTIIQNVHDNGVDKIYKNLQEANSDLYFSSKYHTRNWYKKTECMGIYLKKYNISKDIAYALNSHENVIETRYWCDYYPRDCNMLKAIKDNTIHLKCSALETYDNSAIRTLFNIFVFLLILFYLPFIFVCTLKFALKILNWIFLGFQQSKEQKKSKK